MTYVQDVMAARSGNCSIDSLIRPGFKLTPISWTNFKGFHEKV